MVPNLNLQQTKVCDFSEMGYSDNNFKIKPEKEMVE